MADEVEVDVSEAVASLKGTIEALEARFPRRRKRLSPRLASSALGSPLSSAVSRLPKWRRRRTSSRSKSRAASARPKRPPRKLDGIGPEAAGYLLERSGSHQHDRFIGSRLRAALGVSRVRL
jgi:hypothetical protein